MVTDLPTSPNASRPATVLLGPRFGGTPGDEVLRAIDRRHVDVLSWNCYNEGQFTSPLLREVNARLDRIALGEIAPVTTRSVP